MGDDAVYKWIAGKTSPRPPVARDLVQLSDRRISLSDVYKHREIVGS